MVIGREGPADGDPSRENPTLTMAVGSPRKKNHPPGCAAHAACKHGGRGEGEGDGSCEFSDSSTRQEENGARRAPGISTHTSVSLAEGTLCTLHYTTVNRDPFCGVQSLFGQSVGVRTWSLAREKEKERGTFKHSPARSGGRPSVGWRGDKGWVRCGELNPRPDTRLLASVTPSRQRSRAVGQELSAALWINRGNRSQ